MKKATHQTDRSTLTDFRQIINIGPASAGDFHELGFNMPQQLVGKDPWNLYRQLCLQTKQRHDPCVLDVIIAAVDYMNGNQPQVWWNYTEQRKRDYTARIEGLMKELE